MTVTRHTGHGKKIRAGRWPRGYRSQEWAARQLGVSREHLNRVLNGKRASRSLRQRYDALMGRQA